MPILGHFGNLKMYIHIKHGPKIYSVFPIQTMAYSKELQLYRSSFTASHTSHSCWWFMFHLILHIYFTINATVTLFTDVFSQSNSLSEKHNLPPETAMTLNSYTKKIHMLRNDTLRPYTASKNDILKLSDPSPRHIFRGVPTLGFANVTRFQLLKGSSACLYSGKGE